MEFEKTLKELEELVKRLEDKELGLEEGIRLFEQGMDLTKACLDSLSESKSRIDVIKAEMAKLLDEVEDET